MKVDFEQLQELNEQSAEAAEAAAEATGAGQSDQITGTARTAMEEFVAQERARQELVQTIEENRQPSGMEALAETLSETLKDDEMRKFLYQAFSGDNGFSDPELSHKNEPNPFEAPENQPQAEAPEPQSAEATELPAEATGDGYHLTTDDVYRIMESVLGDMAEMSPNMTAQQMAQHAEANEEVVKPELEAMLNRITEDAED